MKINEIRFFLKENSQFYSDRNDTKIEDIKSGQKYYFIGKCGHEFDSLPTNVFKNNDICCPYCSNHRVLVGFNDMWTTAPEYAKHLKNPEDGYKYTKNSNIKLDWICPDCGTDIHKAPNKMISSKTICNKCNFTISYGEKFIVNLLDQLYVNYEKEKTFDWSDNKRYDFYIPLKKCIIEVHGRQHFSSSDFSYLNGRNYVEEQLNDKYKKDLALQNGIKHYIVLDSRKSEMNWMKHSIMESDLQYILCFYKDDIDWEECHKSCLDNLTKLICEDYKSGQKDLHKLSEKYKMSYNTIRTRLKNGTILGWCNYDPEENKKINSINAGKRTVATMSKPVIQLDLYGNYINEFPSIQEAQRQLKLSHIWDCVTGKRKTVGGYQWRYADDCENVKPVVYEKSGKPYKQINQYDKKMNLIKTWNSIAEASKELNIERAGIIATCNNRQKTAGGFIWKYKEEEMIYENNIA